MQTSILTPVTLCSLPEEGEAALLLPLLPSGSKVARTLAEIPSSRLTILLPQDAVATAEATAWVQSQTPHRQRQIMVILPTGMVDKAFSSFACNSRPRPVPLNEILQFLQQHPVLPELPEDMRLTERETLLLEQLYTAGDAVSHEQLMQQIWGKNSTAMDTHTLETHLYRLRKKLEGSAWQITTEGGAYRLSSL